MSTTEITAPTVYTGADLYGYRCGDCLSRWTFPGAVRGGLCYCGGKAECVGRLLSGRVLLTVTACDERCTWATGPHCSCSCGGVNHGTHAVVEKIGPVFQVKVTPDAQNVADEWRATLAEANAENMRLRETVYAAHGSYLPSREWRVLAEIRGYLNDARKRNSHKTRMADLSAALDTITLYGEDV